MGIKTTLSTAISGLQAAQIGIDVTNNNIANAETEGYVRQSVNTAQRTSYSIGEAGYVGTGVDVDEISRVVTHSLNNEINSQNSTYSEFNSKTEYYKLVESYVNEPSDTGINQLMIDMYSSFNELEDDFEDVTLKNIAVSATTDYITAANQLVNNLENLKTTIASDRTAKITDLEDTLSDLEVVNNEIFRQDREVGTISNSLLNERDLLLSEISQYGDIKVGYNDDGTVKVDITINDGVNPDETMTLLDSSPSGFNIPDSAYYVDRLTTGNLKGLNDINTTIDSYITEIEDMMVQFATSANTAYRLSGENTDDLITYDVTDPLNTMQVNQNILDDVSQLNLGTAGAVASDLGTLNEKLDFDGMTNNDFYIKFVTQTGTDTADNNSSVKIEGTILEQLQYQKDSYASVSLDEEAVNLVTYQSAYEANAKVVSVVQDMMDALLGMVR